MILYRFSHPKFAHDISGTGARLRGGRWNPVGIPALYTSESISLALLEVLANAHTLEELKPLQLMEITIPDNADYHEVKLQSLKKNWHEDFDYSQWLGQEILLNKKPLFFQCPSAIIHREKNYLVNPLHPDIKKIKLSVVPDFYFDDRLFKPQPVN